MDHQEQIAFDTTGHRQMDDLTDQIVSTRNLLSHRIPPFVGQSPPIGVGR